MMLIFIECDLLAELMDFAIHPDTDKALLSQPLKDLLVLPFFLLHQRRQQQHFFTLLAAKQRLQHIMNRLGADRLAALWAVRLTGAGKQQAEMIVNLRDCAHGGTRIFAGGFLLDGDSGGQPFQQVDIGFVHLAKELPGIGGQ